jgi:hypothetical protein
MKVPWLTLVGMIVAAILAAAWVPLPKLFAAFQPGIVTLSIMVAGILVRLNRGMPTIDWKSLRPGERKNLTHAVEELTREYLYILGANALLALSFIALTVVGAYDIAELDDQLQRVIAGAIVALAVLCISRMAYVVWRDYDIVRLQRTLIDAAADRETDEEQRAEAARRIAEMKGAGLIPQEPSPIVKWSE